MKREKFPHWHDYDEWAKHTSMNYEKFYQMTPEEFADWVQSGHKTEEVMGFFYSMKWPEGLKYCMDTQYAIWVYDLIKRRVDNWHPLLTRKEINDVPSA